MPSRAERPDRDTVPTLVVDDEQLVRQSIIRTLEKHGHACTGASGAREARKALAVRPYELVLCDVNMPGESGLEFVKTILNAYHDTAVIMVSGVDDPEVAQVALEAGVYGYVLKPFTRNSLLINVSNALIRRRLEMENRAARNELVELVRSRTEELWTSVKRLATVDDQLRESVYDTIRRMSLATELRDEETAMHIERMSRYAQTIARRLGLDEERCDELLLASRLHDSGKVGIPDRVLRKKGKLDREEMELMQTHTEIGHRLFEGSTAQVLTLAGEIAYTHHERWDGTGYPRGLKGEAIPIEGRVAIVADVFDALMSKRSYKPAFPVGKTVTIMRDGRGTLFDPFVLDSFLDVIDEALEISQEYGDSRGGRVNPIGSHS